MQRGKTMLGKNQNGDIQTQYNQGERNFIKTQLRRIDLRNAQLKGINLQGSDLSYADLRGADLSGANLSQCYLNEANLSDANLQGANLTGAYLIKAYLTKVNFQKAILKETYFTGSFLTRANFYKADLCGAFLNGAHISGAIFQEASYDTTTRFDKGFNPESLKMVKHSSFNISTAKKVTIGELVGNFENIAGITSKYLGGTITVKHFEDSRPDVEWLQGFVMDKTGKVTYSDSPNHQATTMQLKWFEKWTNSFIKKCSLIIQDLPDIIQEKHLTVDYLLKKKVA